MIFLVPVLAVEDNIGLRSLGIFTSGLSALGCVIRIAAMKSNLFGLGSL